MKTMQELQEEMKVLQEQIQQQKAKQEEERIAKLAQAKQEQQTNADFKNLTPQIQEMTKRIITQRELKEELKSSLKLEDLTKQDGHFKVKVIRATTEEQRKLLKTVFWYNNTPYEIRKTQTQLEKDIATAKRTFRGKQNNEAREIKEKFIHQTRTRKKVLSNIEDIVYYYDRREHSMGYVEFVMKHFTQFLSEDQAKAKLNAMLKPRLERKQARQIKEYEEYIKEYEECITKRKAIQVGKYV